jgi:hypothetical protein
MARCWLQRVCSTHSSSFCLSDRADISGQEAEHCDLIAAESGGLVRRHDSCSDSSCWRWLLTAQLAAHPIASPLVATCYSLSPSRGGSIIEVPPARTVGEFGHIVVVIAQRKECMGQIKSSVNIHGITILWIQYSVDDFSGDKPLDLRAWDYRCIHPGRKIFHPTIRRGGL